MTFQPIHPRWLSPGFDMILADEPELMLAYKLEDYPDEMSGEGEWVDMYLSADGTGPIGRLWASTDLGSIGLEVPPTGGNTDHLTRVALQLREFHEAGSDVLVVFDFIKAQYHCGVVHTGDLADVRVEHGAP